MTTESARIRELQREREHLEKLFSDRINFYLVFAAGVFAFVLDKNPENKYAKPALVSVCLISFIMLLALLRTFRLVVKVLDEIREKHHGTAYSQFSRAIRIPGNANKALIALPIILTAFFTYALYMAYH
jgi:hypothetical protein